MERDEALELLPAYALGAVSTEEAAEVEALLNDWPAGRGELAELLAATEALALIPEQAPVLPLGLEGRIISRAREERRPTRAKMRAKVLPRRRLPPPRLGARFLPHALAAALAVVAVVFGWMAFDDSEPAPPGQAVYFVEDRSQGVYVSTFVGRPFSLAFWGLAAPAEGERYQLWTVREGEQALVPGPFFEPDETGRAALPISPETAQSLVGFVVTRDDPADRTSAVPLRDAVVYNFTLD